VAIVVIAVDVVVADILDDNFDSFDSHHKRVDFEQKKLVFDESAMML
jgi:hypothetical protein